MLWNRPRSTWYLMLPIASAPMPTALPDAAAASGTPSSIGPIPAIPGGGTAFTSAATSSARASRSSASDTTSTPALAAAMRTSARAIELRRRAVIDLHRPARSSRSASGSDRTRPGRGRVPSGSRARRSPPPARRASPRRCRRDRCPRAPARAGRRERCRASRAGCFSTTATTAAAVVNAPLGSARTETANGGTIASRAASSMSSARSRSRPPMQIPVRRTRFGPREKIASCVRPATSASVTPV